ncbi:MAG: peroxiredoxin [Thaumarchaeota archaeon]|nr:peroxiredoxin [Nitrososphaerota archaeon]
MQVGDIAPDFELKADTGETVRLSSHIGKKKVILFFYVKDNTPGCTAEVCGFRDYFPKISDQYEIFGINQDSEESHKEFCQRNELQFKLLSDPGKKVAGRYNAKGVLGMYTKRITYLIGLDSKIEKIVEGLSVSNHIEFVQSLLS